MPFRFRNGECWLLGSVSDRRWGGGFWTLRAHPAHLLPTQQMAWLHSAALRGEERREPLPGPGLLPEWPLQDPQIGAFWRQGPGLQWAGYTGGLPGPPPELVF